jgi:hypothetical protein
MAQRGQLRTKGVPMLIFLSALIFFAFFGVPSFFVPAAFIPLACRMLYLYAIDKPLPLSTSRKWVGKSARGTGVEPAL